jgi:hypothetical protein
MKSSDNPYGVAPNTANTPQTNFAPSKNNGLAIASLILGILSLVFYIFSAIPGIITGHMALSRAKRSPQEYEGKGMAIAGLILSYIMLVLSVVLLVWMVYMFTAMPGFSDAFKDGFQQGLQQDMRKLQ